LSQISASRCVLDGRIGIEAPSVSWLGGNSCGAAFPFRRRFEGSNQRSKQWCAPGNSRLTVARRRRFFTVFPCTESRSLWTERRTCEIHRLRAPRGKS